MTASTAPFTLTSKRVHDISRWLAMVSTITCFAFMLFSLVAQLPAFFVFFTLYTAIYGVIWWRNQANQHRGNALALFISIDSGILLLGLLLSSKPILAPAYMLLMAFPFFYKASDRPLVVAALASIPLGTYFTQLIVQTFWITAPLQPLANSVYVASAVIFNGCIFACAMMIFQQFSLDRNERHRLQHRVTDQEKNYDLLDRAWQASERVSQEKNKLLLTIGHELRTPLTSIVGHLDLIDEQDIPPNKLDHWQHIMRSSKTLSGLLDDILEYSEFYNGNHRLNVSSVDLADMCQQVLSDHQAAAAVQRSQMLYIGPQHFLMHTDAHKVRRILNHLINNAIKFRRPNQDSHQIQITLTVTDANVQIAVQDNGLGIAETMQQQVFKAFWQPDPSMARRHQGNGLGLYLSQQLSQLLGGALTVQSELGQGSTFTLGLPVTRPPQTPPPKPTQPCPFSNAMVVEDNPVNRKVMHAMLERLHLPAIMTGNGQEAVSRYLECKPDVMLMDLQMPVMDGLQACEKIRQIEHERGLARCYIIAVSANATQQDRALARTAGMDDFLVKPYRFSALQAVLCSPQS